MNTFDAIRRFPHLTASDRRTALQALFSLLATWTGLRVFGFRRWSKFLGDRVSAVPSADPDFAAQAQRIARLHNAVANQLFFRTNCLERALALSLLLRRRGIPAHMRIGTRFEARRLEAHAWIEVLGVPLNEDSGEHRHFVPFDGLYPLKESLPD